MRGLVTTQVIIAIKCDPELKPVFVGWPQHMRRIAILVIAAVNQPIYVHYIKTYWTDLIRYLSTEKPHIDVFLLFEHGTKVEVLKDLEANIVEDVTSDFSKLCDPQYHSCMIPGVLSKTIYSLQLLHDKYDVFFRTNLSSLIKVSSFDSYVQNKKDICYSGAWVWEHALRTDLLHHKKIGFGKSIKTLSELDSYKGNTFISGSGYFLNANEASSLVRRKKSIRYDIIDDVSVGLMFSEYERIPGFSVNIKPDKPVEEIGDILRETKACHIRLEHFPLSLADILWAKLGTDRIWR